MTIFIQLSEAAAMRRSHRKCGVKGLRLPPTMVLKYCRCMAESLFLHIHYILVHTLMLMAARCPSVGFSNISQIKTIKKSM